MRRLANWQFTGQAASFKKLTDVPANQVLHVVEDGVQTKLPGDVNRDGLVDILDFPYHHDTFWRKNHRQTHEWISTKMDR